MRNILIAAILTAVAGFAAAEERLSSPLPDIHVAPYQMKHQPTFVQPGQVSPLDIQIQNAMIGVGQIFVSCNFDGQADNCLLDTGSDICLVDNDSFFGKYPADGQRCSEGASGQKVCSDIIDIADLKVGGIDFGVQQAQRRTSDQSCFAASGGAPQMPSYLVGSVWHSMLGHQVTFNFGAKTLSVDVGAAPAGMQPMTLVLDNTFLVVPVAFGNSAPVKMLVDTGAGLSVLDQSYVDSNPSGFSFLTNSQIEDSSCQKIPVKIYRINGIGVSGKKIASSFGVAMDLTTIKQALGNDVQGIIGFNAIDKFNWVVDLKNYQFAVTPVGGASAVETVQAEDIPSVIPMRLPSLLQRAH